MGNKNAIYIGAFIALLFVQNAACAQTDHEGVFASVLRQWDSVASYRDAQAISQDGGPAKRQRSIQNELKILSSSAQGQLLERYVSKMVDHPRFLVRIASRIEERGYPDTILRRGDTLIPVYPPPDFDYVEWIIGTSDSTVTFVYKDQKSGDIVEKRLDCPKLFRDSLESLDRRWYSVSAGPPWLSTVSIWTPSLADHVFVYNLLTLSAKDRQGAFIHAGPQGLRWIAEITKIRFGYK